MSNLSTDIEQFTEMLSVVLSIVFPVFIIGILTMAAPRIIAIFKEMIEAVPETPKQPKKEPQKPREPIYKSDDGKGYWVRGYGDEITYVPLTDLYPAGTNMDELRDLKSKEAAK